MENKDRIYKEAIDSFNSKNYDRSTNLLNVLLEQDSKYHPAYNLLGLSLYLSNEIILSINNFKKAIELSPNNIDYILNLVKSHLQINQKEEAKNILKKSISLNTTQLRLYRELASILYSENLLEEALNVYMKIISLSPNEHQAYNNCGLIFTKLRDFNNAYKYIEKAISLNPNVAQYYFNMTLALLSEGDDFFTEKYFIKSYDEYKLLSNNYLSKADYAIAYGLKAVKLNPNNPEYHNYLGNAYLSKELNEKDCNNALICFKNAITLNPNKSDYYSNIAFTYNELGMYDDAFESYQKLKSLLASNTILSSNYAYFLLKKTDCHEGIEALEKSRVELNKVSKSLIVSRLLKKYNKEYNLTPNIDLRNKVVYVITEGGIGDEIQFVRYIKLLKDRGAYVKFFCSNIFKPVLEYYSCCDELITSKEEHVEFDYLIPLLSIPHLFNDNSFKMDDKITFPYLSYSKDKFIKWKNFFGNYKKKRIAFTWKSKFPTLTFYRRSTDFDYFYDLAKSFPDIDFFAIQKGYFEEEFHNKDNLSNIFDLSDKIEDFSDSAGIIDNIDELISIDSAIVHISGGLNKPVTMLLPYSADWRWGISGNKTFWYPSMEILRQTEIGNWQTVFEQVKNKLKRFN